MRVRLCLGLSSSLPELVRWRLRKPCLAVWLSLYAFRGVDRLIRESCKSFPDVVPAVGIECFA